jgi:hypothetical protein
MLAKNLIYTYYELLFQMTLYVPESSVLQPVLQNKNFKHNEFKDTKNQLTMILCPNVPAEPKFASSCVRLWLAE